MHETNPEYPAICQFDRYRVIRCKDDIQFIVQEFYGNRWRNLSYHVYWSSLSRRYPTAPQHLEGSQSDYKRGESAESTFPAPTLPERHKSSSHQKSELAQ